MTAKYDREAGLEMFREVYCNSLGELPPAGTSKFTDFMLETLFGTLWSDTTLSIRDRRLLLIGVIAAQGDETTLAIQLRSAMKRKELAPEQFEVITMFLTQYIGYPLSLRFSKAAREAIGAQSKDNEV